MYPHTFIQQKPMTDYNMTSGVGRTYRYYEGTPLFPFGHGLSYTSFESACELDALDALDAHDPTLRPPGTATPPGRVAARLSCVVRNAGKVWGDEVLLLYHAVGGAIREAFRAPRTKARAARLCASERAAGGQGARAV